MSLAKQLRERCTWETSNPAVNDLLAAASELEQYELALKLSTDYAGQTLAALRELLAAVDAAYPAAEAGMEAQTAWAERRKRASDAAKLILEIGTGNEGSDGEESRRLPVGGAQSTQVEGDPDRMPLSVGRSRPDQTATNLEYAVVRPQSAPAGWLDAFESWLEMWDRKAFDSLRGPGLTMPEVKNYRAAYCAGAEWAVNRRHSQVSKQEPTT